MPCRGAAEGEAAQVLAALQAAMTAGVAHPAGLNPEAFRRAASYIFSPGIRGPRTRSVSVLQGCRNLSCVSDYVFVAGASEAVHMILPAADRYRAALLFEWPGRPDVHPQLHLNFNAIAVPAKTSPLRTAMAELEIHIRQLY